MTHLSDFLHQIHASAGDWVTLTVCGERVLRPAQADDVLFYVVLDGTVVIDAKGSRPLNLGPSDVAMVFGGVDHAVRTGLDAPPAAFDYFSTPHDHDEPPALRIGEGAVAAKLVVGKVRISWPMVLRPAAMPACLLLHMGPTEASAAEIVGLFTRAAVGAGASAYLTKLAELAMLRTLRENVELLRRLPPDAASLQVARSLRLIRSQPDQDWSVARLAREVGMSRSSFADKFVHYAGRRPMEAVTEERMRFAAELLDSEQANVADIATRAGYRSQAAFARRFEQFFGVTPGRYRRQMRQARGTGEVGQVDPALLGLLP